MVCLLVSRDESRLWYGWLPRIGVSDPLATHDYTGNTRLAFADVVWLFNHL
jgi:hypothetical protein